MYAICTDSGRLAVSAENEQTLTELRGLGLSQCRAAAGLLAFSGFESGTTQAARGDVLLTIGGGVGVEHLAELYAEKRDPVIPLDIDIGSFHNALPEEVLGWQRKHDRIRVASSTWRACSMTAAAHLDGLRTHTYRPTLDAIASRLTALLGSSTTHAGILHSVAGSRLPAVCGRRVVLLIVVDPVVEERGFQRLEVGTDPQRHGFINTEIFRELHFAPITIADMTGQRPNCAIELGYALGRGHMIILTARHSEKLPFDVDKLPFLFWSREESTQDLQ